MILLYLDSFPKSIIVEPLWLDGLLFVWFILDEFKACGTTQQRGAAFRVTSDP